MEETARHRKDRSSASTSTSLYDPYIRVPSDLFGQQHRRHVPALLLPMSTRPSASRRTAGVYPPPRPISRPQPWTLESRWVGARRDVGHSILLERYGGGREGDVVADTRHARGWDQQGYGHKTHRRRGYRPAAVWQQRESVPCHSPLAFPAVSRKDLQKRMKAAEVLDEAAMAAAHGSDDDGGDLDDFIDEVARANNVEVETAAILPVVRASPCAMHSRNLVPLDRRGLDLLYATNCHGGRVSPTKGRFLRDSPRSLDLDTRGGGQGLSRVDYTPRSLRETALLRDIVEIGEAGGGGGGGLGLGGVDRKDNNNNSNNNNNNNNRGTRGGTLQAKDKYVSQRGRNPFPPSHHARTYPAKLPAELPANDVVLSWLKHGSAPVGESHFPDITQPTNRTVARRLPNQSAVSE